ncbi:MAG: histidine kinase [Eubacteriales bacterium]|nr:histidine kinase [Eubacteriales bacterium]
MSAKKYPASVFSRPKVQKQLVTIFIIVLLIPVTFCIFILRQSNRSLNEHYQEQTASDNQRVKSIMFDVTTNIYNAAENLASDQELLELLYTDYSSWDEVRRAVDQYKGIYNILARDTSVSSINIYTLNETIGDYSYFHTVTEDIQKKDWYLKASRTPSVFWETRHRTDTHHNMYWELNLYRRIPLPQNGSFAVMNITVSDNYLKNRIDNTTMEAILTVNENPVFYSSEKAFTGNGFPLEIDSSAASYSYSGDLELRGKKVTASVSTLVPLNSDDRLYMLSYDPDAPAHVRSVLMTYIWITAAVIVIPCILFLVYSWYFSGRILMLRKAMYQASHGNYDIMDSFTGNDEISETFLDLRTMIDEIKSKEAEIYTAKIREQEIINRQQQMEFKVLASQINPHFLYNTLETIRMKAFTAGDREVATAIKLLGKSLRYVLENTGTVSIPLSKELDYIHTYISIQKLRFGSRFDFEEDIQPSIDLTEYKILPLMLQPIVENSISHGLEGIETGGHILLEIYELEPFLYICISDNGKGMTDEELKHLRQRINTRDETRTRSIGLSNINHRLQLCYGAECRLQAESTVGIRTAFTLKLPLNKIREES